MAADTSSALLALDLAEKARTDAVKLIAEARVLDGRRASDRSAVEAASATAVASASTATARSEAAGSYAAAAAASAEQAEENVVAGVAATGQRIVTTTNPQKLLNGKVGRKMWRVFNLSGAVPAYLGYSDNPAEAGIPLSIGGTALPGYVADIPVETNEIWFHGAVGSELSVQEG